jgi:hypothetical protein
MPVSTALPESGGVAVDAASSVVGGASVPASGTAAASTAPSPLFEASPFDEALLQSVAAPKNAPVSTVVARKCHELVRIGCLQA